LLQPKKSLGQNFLIDKNISKKIVSLIKDINRKNIIEIGPGKGALTEIIIKNNPKKLILIEKDQFLFNELSFKYKKNKIVEIHNQDALNFDYSHIDKPKSIIGNLPYNISIKLIINSLKKLSNYKEIVFMIQKDVARKMSYKNSIKKNRLNVLTEISSNFEIKFDVSKNVFFPKPKVISSVIKMTPNNKLKFNFTDFENFTRMLFRNKRKIIQNILPKDKLKILKENNDEYYNTKILKYRAEDLTIEKIFTLFRKFS